MSFAIDPHYFFAAVLHPLLAYSYLSLSLERRAPFFHGLPDSEVDLPNN